MFQGSKILAEAWDSLLKHCNGDQDLALVLWNEAANLGRAERIKESTEFSKKVKAFAISSRKKLDELIMEAMNTK